MKNLILLTTVLLAACGTDDPGKVSHPPPMPPEVPKEDTPDGPPETIDYGNGNIASARALYNAEQIEVFYTPLTRIREGRGFDYILKACALFGVAAGHSFDKIGVLNGMFKRQGYTKDFLLNPEVERTWYHSDGTIFTAREANLETEFSHPRATLRICVDGNGNEVACKRFLCGVDKGE